MMNDPGLAGMLPFDTMGLYEPPKPRYIFKMPRVVPEQKEKFDSEDLFKKVSRDSEVSLIHNQICMQIVLLVALVNDL